MISFAEFKKLELRVGKITEAERVAGSEKLLKLKVDLGLETRQIIAGLGKTHAPETLIGKEVVIVVNLEPKTMMGLESQGMVLAADCDNSPILLSPEREVPPGSLIR